METHRSRWENDSDNAAEVLPDEEGTWKMHRRSVIKCELCEVKCSSVETLQAHFSGARHQKKLALKGLSRDLISHDLVRDGDELNEKVVACYLCNVIFHGLERATHFTSKQHRAHSRLAEDTLHVLVVIADAPVDVLDENADINVDTPERVPDGYRCKLCDTVLPTLLEFHVHVAAKKHQKKARWHYLSKEGDDLEVRQYWCRLCNKFCSDQDVLTAHYGGKGHLKVLRKKGLIGDVQLGDSCRQTRKEMESDSDESEHEVPSPRCRRRRSESDSPSSEGEVWCSPSSLREWQKKNRSHRRPRRRKSCATPSPPHKKRCSPSPQPRKKGGSPSPGHKKRCSLSTLPWRKACDSSRRKKSCSPSPPPRRRRKHSHSHHRQQRDSSQSSSSRSRSDSRTRRQLKWTGSSHRLPSSKGSKKSRSYTHRGSRSRSRSRWHSSESDDSQSSVSSSSRTLKERNKHYSTLPYYAYSRFRSSPRWHSSGSGMWKRGGSRERTRSRSREEHSSFHDRHCHTVVVPGSESEGEGSQPGFKGFPPPDEQSPDVNAPPISSLSVSFILHSLRKECKENRISHLYTV